MPAGTVPHGPGPKATPLFYDGKLYTLGISGIVSAFDAATGKRLWQVPKTSPDPLYGTAMSPSLTATGSSCTSAGTTREP
jgi:outer membrane protein assembly factor BamB